MDCTQIIQLPAFTDNYLWLLHAQDRAEAVAIDPGDAAVIESTLKKYDLSLTAILLTHRHPDHTGGVAALQARYPHIPVYGPASPAMPMVTHVLAEGMTLKLPALPGEFTVWAVPGHTDEHIAYYYTEHHSLPRLFSGDIMFAGGCGRVKDGHPEQLFASLQRLCLAPPNTLVYAAHEYTESNLRFATTVAPHLPHLSVRYHTVQAQRAIGVATIPTSLTTELHSNIFLLTDDAGVQQAAERWRAEQAPDLPLVQDALSCFISLRAWKNEFR